MAITHLETTEAFDGAIKGDVPTLVKFTADWCGPCKAVAPVVEELAREFDGRLNVLEVDIDAHRSVPERYSVKGVPTFILFEDGEPGARLVGAAPKQKFLDVLQPLVS